MGTSGNPAKKAAAKKTAAKTPAANGNVLEVSKPSAFKQLKKGRVLQLPSGLIARCQKVGLETFLSSGQGDVPNPLMEIVGEALEKGQKADVAKMVSTDEGEIDLTMIADMYQMVNSVVMEVVMEPKVEPAPEHEDDRSDDVVYIDEFDDEDKMFLFQWSMGGTEDVARFREEAREDMASLAEGPSKPRPTKRTAGSRAR